MPPRYINDLCVLLIENTVFRYFYHGIFLDRVRYAFKSTSMITHMTRPYIYLSVSHAHILTEFIFVYVYEAIPFCMRNDSHPISFLTLRTIRTILNAKKTRARRVWCAVPSQPHHIK